VEEYNAGQTCSGRSNKQASATATVGVTALATIKLIKSIVPSGDAGKFDLKIDTTTFDNSGAGYGNTGTTGFLNVATGSHTISEVAHTGSSLSNYDTAISCDTSKGGNSGSTSFTFSVVS